MDKWSSEDMGLMARVAEDVIQPTGRGPLVAILLATFNGELYLQRQLESLVDQTYQDWRVLWRDDGSSDRSREIMEIFASAVGPDRCVEAGPRGARLGAAKSFFALLQQAKEYRLVVFSDQDDVWLPHKLQRAVDHLESQTPGMPSIYCARQAIVGKGLERRRLSPLPKFGPGFPSALLQNIVTGCTAMLNKEAVRLINSTQPPENTIHDWWCYIVVAAARGRIIFDPIPVILYRQHGNNAIGASSFIPEAFRALRRGPTQFLRQLENHVVALEGLEGLLPPPSLATARKILRALSRGRLARIALMRERGFRRQTCIGNLGMTMWMLASYSCKDGN